MTHRKLIITSFQELQAEISRLQRQGYTKNGNWNLAQICNHCCYFNKMYYEDYPAKIKKIPWLLRYFVGTPLLRKILKSRWMIAGGYTPQNPLPTPDLDEHTEIESLYNSFERLLDPRTELFLKHPFWGEMTREQVIELNLIHCTHHLGFLVPNS